MGILRAILVAALAGFAAPAAAMTGTGTMITNVVSMTFGVAYGIGFQVSFNLTARAIVGSPAVTIAKNVNPTGIGAGGTLTYTITLVNPDTTDSAFNLHVEDIIPGASGVVAYIQGQDNWVTGTAGAAVTLGYGMRMPWNVINNWFWGSEMTAGQSGPYALRWVISVMGPGKSATLCWKARVL